MSRRAHAIAERLEALILSGEIGEGARLDEAGLAARFGVSRTPIREALRVLAAGGLASHRPGRGVFVVKPTPVELLEMFEAMAELEAACGRLAAQRMPADGIAALETANALCAAAADDADAAEYYRQNAIFHGAIYAGAGNGFLAREATRLHERLRPYRRAQLSLRGRMAQSLTEHQEIAEAIGAGDPDRAAEALRSHVSVQGEKFHLLMRAHAA